MIARSREWAPGRYVNEPDEVERLSAHGVKRGDPVTVSLVDGKSALSGIVMAGLVAVLVIEGTGNVASLPWAAITAVTRTTTPPHPAI